jgi:hypothetical protein
MSNAAKKWQIQIRTTHLTKWKPKGTYETRDAARAKATELRADWGNRNVRVVRKITGGL